jgi:hypothetical protein
MAIYEYVLEEAEQAVAAERARYAEIVRKYAAEPNAWPCGKAFAAILREIEQTD